MSIWNATFWSNLQSLTKLLEQNRGSVEAPNFVSRSLRAPPLTQGWGGGNHALHPCRPQKGNFSACNTITVLQRSDFQILFRLILSKIVVADVWRTIESVNSTKYNPDNNNIYAPQSKTQYLHWTEMQATSFSLGILQRRAGDQLYAII